MRVLVTGGAGYIGSHVARALIRAGHEVEILDDLSRGRPENVALVGHPIKFHIVDLRDFRATLDVLQRDFDAVLHFAGLSSVAESVERPDLYWHVNLRGGLTLLAAMRDAGVERLVYSSTAAVYGEASPRLRIPESANLAPVNPYGASKLALEYALRAEADASGLHWLALRYFNAAGASDEGDLGECHDPETHLIPRAILAARRGESFSYFGRDHDTRDGTCLRDFIHVEDLARAHVLALEKLDVVHERGNEAINLGTGHGATVLEVLAAVERVTRKKLVVDECPRRAGDPAALVADPRRAETVLGFRAERSLEDAIRSQNRFLDLV